MKINFLYEKNDFIVISLLSLLAFFVLAFASTYIDFHADEAIYYDAIVMNLRNDSGLFYILFYSFIGKIFYGVEGARIASSLLGGLTLFMILNTFKLLGINQIKNYFIISAVFLISYQAFFLFDRVRPEASWWFITSALFYALIRFSQNKTTFNTILLSIFIVLLPMNHRLTWFICIFLIGYIVLFLIREVGWKKSLLFFTLIFVGMFLNIYIRALSLDMPLIDAIKISFSGTDMGEGSSLKDFLNNVLFGAPYFLNDKAANLNFYEYIFGVRNWTSHNFIQNSYLFLIIILPFLARSFKSFYIFSLPLGAFIGFYLSGYFNPTYVPGFTLVILMYLIYLSSVIHNKFKYVVYLLIAISIINGVSFLSTRVFSHSEASYYSSLETIEKIVFENPNAKTIAIPERFTPALRDIKIKKYVTFKDDIPENIDLLIIDDYDYLMYVFVPEHNSRLNALNKLSENMCLVDKKNLPIYFNDYIFPEIKDENTVRMGSWFFRNSSTYNLSIYKRCK